MFTTGAQGHGENLYYFKNFSPQGHRDTEKIFIILKTFHHRGTGTRRKLLIVKRAYTHQRH
jgi:hypothetical protein